MVGDMEQNPAFERLAQFLTTRLLSRGIRPDTLESWDAPEEGTILDLLDMRVLHRFVHIFHEHGWTPSIPGSDADSTPRHSIAQRLMSPVSTTYNAGMSELLTRIEALQRRVYEITVYL